MTITQADALEAFHYNPDTGEFLRKFKNGIKLIEKLDANGYLRVYFNCKSHKVHRIIWLYMTGSFPTDQIDHINGVRSDNRFCNLRQATSRQNNQNVSLRKDNVSGFKGVSWSKKRNKWYVQISIKGEIKNLGRFIKIEDAIDAYNNAAKKLHGEFYCATNSRKSQRK
jgi:hypothetical protein